MFDGIENGPMQVIVSYPHQKDIWKNDTSKFINPLMPGGYKKVFTLLDIKRLITL